MNGEDVMFPVTIAIAVVALIAGVGLLTQGTWVLGLAMLVVTVGSAVQAWRLR